MKRIALLIGAALSFGVQAATLTAGDNIELLVIDGKKIEQKGWSKAESVELANGEHQIVARFDGEVKRGSQGTIYTTRPYLFNIDIKDQNAEIVLSDTLTTLSQAEAYFARGPEWQVKFANGSEQVLDATELKGSGFAAYADMEKLVAQYNSENGIIFEQGNPVDLEKVAVKVDEQGKVKITGDNLTQLKMWYSKATPEEKKAFKMWMTEQDYL
ncbi:YccT family protein [Photobacterium damselae]|uniref:YccT family protein n=1 Tax=Photobacterium damselae TaxID=38293 RepID=UPI004069338F